MTLTRVAVRLDVARVGVLGLEGGERPQVRARLHAPTGRRGGARPRSCR